MKNAKEQVSSSAFMFSVACYIICSSLLYGYFEKISKNDTLIAIVFGFIVSLPILWIFSTLCEKYPGKNLFEINEIVLGKIFGKLLSCLYLFFFFSLTFTNADLVNDFIVEELLPNTPSFVITILFTILCCYAVRKGFESISSYSVLFFIVFFVTILIAFVFLIDKMNLNNFLPAFSLPVKNYLRATHQIAIIPFSNIIVFTMICPSLKNPNKIKKPLFGGLILGAISMLIIVFIDISVLGPSENIVDIPSFDAVRLINISNFLTRLDFLFATVFLMAFFFKISIIYYAVASGIAQIFNLKSYKPFVPIIGVLIIYFATISFQSLDESTNYFSTIMPIYQTFFELILPAITLIITIIVKHRKNKGVIT